MTSLTPQLSLELAAALLSAAGQAAPKPSAIGFSDVLGDVSKDDDDAPAPVPQHETDPAKLLPVSTVPIPSSAPPPPPPPITGTFGLKSDELPQSRDREGAIPAAPDQPVLLPEAGEIAATPVPVPARPPVPDTVPAPLPALIGRREKTVASSKATPATNHPKRSFAKPTPASATTGSTVPLPAPIPVAAPSTAQVTPESSEPIEDSASKSGTPRPIAASAPRLPAAEPAEGVSKVAFLAKLTPKTPDTAQPAEESQWAAAPQKAPTPIAADEPAAPEHHQRTAEPPPQPAAQPDAPTTSVAAPHAAAEPIRAEVPPHAERVETPQPVRESPAPPRPIATPVRDIRLDVSGGEHRVELRLTERAGEVHVAVRTPDAQLAGQLREELPVLSSRLEHAGFRTETWHPAATEERTAEAGLRNSRTESGPGEDARGRQHQESPQQDARDRDQRKPQTSKQKGKQFAWLMSSLR